MQLTDGIWQVEGLRAAHVYLVAADNGIAIIDSGINNSEHAIVDELRRAGYTPDQVRVIVITHAHIDHIGSLPALQHATSAPICTTPGEAAAIEGRTPLPSPPGVHGVLLSAVNRVQRPQPVGVHHLLQPGPYVPHLADWQVVPTPGHTPDHISLYHPARGILLAGDALATIGGVRRSPWLFTSNMQQARASVALLAGLDLRSLLCGHGTPIVNDPTLMDQIRALARRERSQM